MVAEQTISMLVRAIASANRPLAPAAAEDILQWRISDEDHRRMDDLLAKSKKGEWTEAEKEEFGEMCAVGDMLAVLHLRAREALGEFKLAGA
jgi:hypothetical protein